MAKLYFNPVDGLATRIHFKNSGDNKSIICHSGAVFNRGAVDGIGYGAVNSISINLLKYHIRRIKRYRTFGVTIVKGGLTYERILGDPDNFMQYSNNVPLANVYAPSLLTFVVVGYNEIPDAVFVTTDAVDIAKQTIEAGSMLISADGVVNPRGIIDNGYSSPSDIDMPLNFKGNTFGNKLYAGLYIHTKSGWEDNSAFMNAVAISMNIDPVGATMPFLYIEETMIIDMVAI